MALRGGMQLIILNAVKMPATRLERDADPRHDPH
jgi:hypothetical protein